MKFRPCIDLHRGRVKQIVGASLDGETAVENYVSPHPPAYYSRLFREDRLCGGHVIMLGDGNREAAIEALREWPDGLQIGGGVNPGNAGAYLDAGASHVIVTSYIFTDGEIDSAKLREMSAAVGRERLVLDLSCRRTPDGYYIASNGWRTVTETRLEPCLLESLAGMCAEFLIHAVDLEGLRRGVDAELAELLGRFSPIPATYAGGVRNFQDMELIRAAGGGRVDATVGSALDIFGGSMSYSEAVRRYGGQP